MATKIKNYIQYVGIADTLPLYINGLGMFKEFIVEDNLTLDDGKVGIEQISKVIAKVRIIDKKFITTAVGQSLERQTITGKKLVIKGVVDGVIEYIAEGGPQKVYAQDFKLPFCTFIVLPASLTGEEAIVVKGYIEDMCVRQLEENTIYSTVTILVDGQIL